MRFQNPCDRERERGLVFGPVSSLGHFPFRLLDPGFGLEVKHFEADDVPAVRVSPAQYDHRIRNGRRCRAVAISGESSDLKSMTDR